MVTALSKQIESNQMNDIAADADLLSTDSNYSNEVTSTATNNVRINQKLDNSHLMNDKCQDQHKMKSSFTANTIDAKKPLQSSNQLPLTRTIVARNSCGSVNGQNIARSWYARCNRWRSQSCDRRKNTSVRYSWNTNNNSQRTA